MSDSRQFRSKLATNLSDQGARVKTTKAGFLALNPVSGMGAAWHSSVTSDGGRGLKNLRADVIRAGWTWPLDKVTKQREAA